VTLPPEEYAAAWDVVIDTGGTPDEAEVCKAGSTLELQERSVLVLREHQQPVAEPDHSVAASVAMQARRG
jgi:isoamylase